MPCDKNFYQSLRTLSESDKSSNQSQKDTSKIMCELIDIIEDSDCIIPIEK